MSASDWNLCPPPELVLLLPIAELEDEGPRLKPESCLAFPLDLRITRFLLGLHAAHAAAKSVAPMTEKVVLRSTWVRIVEDPRLRPDSGDEHLAPLAQEMRDHEKNVIVDDRVIMLGHWSRPLVQRVEVFENYLQFTGIGPDVGHWFSSSLWPAALHYAELLLAPDHELPGALESMARLDPRYVSDLLAEREVRPDGCSEFRRPMPEPTHATLELLLTHADRRVRETAVAHIGAGSAVAV